MAAFGVHFNYKKEYRNALAYSVLLIFISLFYVGITFVSSDAWNPNLSILTWMYLVAIILFQLPFWGIVTIVFVVLMRNLRDRFVALNSILR